MTAEPPAAIVRTEALSKTYAGDIRAVAANHRGDVPVRGLPDRAGADVLVATASLASEPGRPRG